MKTSIEYNKLGEILVEKLRDESFTNYLELKNYVNSNLESNFKEKSKPNIIDELEKIENEREEFISSLNDKQQKALDKLILNILDTSAFNFLKEIEENLDDNNSIGLTINGKLIENITTQFLSGTLFGEYFLWLEKNSKYGKFQQ